MLSQKVRTPARKRELATRLRERYAISGRRACGLIQLERSTGCNRSVKRDDGALRLRLWDLAAARDSAIDGSASCYGSGMDDEADDVTGPKAAHSEHSLASAHAAWPAADTVDAGIQT